MFVQIYKVVKAERDKKAAARKKKQDQLAASKQKTLNAAKSRSMKPGGIPPKPVAQPKATTKTDEKADSSK
jgi:hypothetical protein